MAYYLGAQTSVPVLKMLWLWPWFIFFLTSFDSRDCYHFEAGLSFVLLTNFFLTKKACDPVLLFSKHEVAFLHEFVFVFVFYFMWGDIFKKGVVHRIGRVYSIWTLWTTPPFTSISCSIKFGLLSSGKKIKHLVKLQNILMVLFLFDTKVFDVYDRKPSEMSSKTLSW